MMSSAPLQNHRLVAVPVDEAGASDPKRTQIWPAPRAKWHVLFTFNDADGENERVLRKVLAHRAQV